MKIVMIGKNDTYRTMLSWKEILGEEFNYFMTHPRIGFEDKSTFNSYLPELAEEADIIFIHIALRDRGYIQKLNFLNFNIEKYIDKTIIYFCGDTNIKENIINYKELYKDFKYFVSNNPKISVILDIPYLPTPIDFNHVRAHTGVNPKKIRGMTIEKIAGQKDRTDKEIKDFFELSLHLEKKYPHYTKEIEGSVYYTTIYNDFFKRCHIFFDTYKEMFKLEALTTCWLAIPTISRLPYEYIKPHIDFTGTWTLPFINVNNYAELKNAFDNLLSNPQFVLHEGQRARRWMQCYWNKNRHIENLNKILNNFGLKGEVL